MVLHFCFCSICKRYRHLSYYGRCQLSYYLQYICIYRSPIVSTDAVFRLLAFRRVFLVRPVKDEEKMLSEVGELASTCLEVCTKYHDYSRFLVG